MEIKIRKNLSKTGKEYVGLWFGNWLVTIDRRAIYKLVNKDDVNKLQVGEAITLSASFIEEPNEEFPM